MAEVPLHTNFDGEVLPSTRTPREMLLRGLERKFHYKAAQLTHNGLLATIYIPQFEFINPYTNLYVEECFHAYKPCSKSNSV